MLLYIQMKLREVWNNYKGEFGIGAVLSIAIALIVSAFILIPGVQTFARSVVASLQGWWSTFSTKIFTTS